MPFMQAVRIHSYGDPSVLTYEQAPCPDPGADEVLIRVHATSVNPFDAALRAGYLAAYLSPNFPLILGTDVSGVVEQVGADVTNVAPGDAVYTRVGVYRDGAYADYAVAPAADVVAKPQTLDHIHAAALPHVILTAWQALIEHAQLAAGQTVLIHGAAGGVGHVAVQLAKLRGAHVIGTASPHNLEFLRRLGVDEAISYPTTPFESVVGNVDVVLDLIGGDTQQRSWSVLKPGGILVSTVQPPSAEQANASGARGAFVTSNPPMGPVLAEVAELVDSGKLRPEVSEVLPLAEATQGHAQIETHHTRGKLILDVAR